MTKEFESDAWGGLEMNNNYLICAWDKNFNCLVRAFKTFNEYQNAIRYLDTHIDLELINGYNQQHMLIYHKSYNDGRF